MLNFAARFAPADEGGYVVTFRDIPEAITQGDSLEEAQAMAADALLTAMDFYFEDRRVVPTPSAKRKGEQWVGLPASAAAKVLLLNELVQQQVKASELARRLETSPQAVNRLIDLHHATKIDSIDAALQALGRRLQVSLTA